jgi:hypothetical protein
MATISVEQSRAIPVEIPRAFDVTLAVPLTAIFSRRYVLLPPIKEVVTTDGGTMGEILTEVDSPHSFSYRLSDITGPLAPLVDGIDGRWEFTARGTGTLITWRWTLHPKGLGARVMPLVTLMWRGYARQALELLSEHLLAADSV